MGQDGLTFASSQVVQNPFSYDFPDHSQFGGKLFPMKLCQNLTLEEATIEQLQQLMSLKQLTTQQLVTCYVQRITQTNGYVRYV